MHACDDGFVAALSANGVAMYRADAVNEAAAYRIGAPADDDIPSAMFCSQLCMLALQTIGALPRTVAARRVSPTALVGWTAGDNDAQLALDSFFERPASIDVDA